MRGELIGRLLGATLVLAPVVTLTFAFMLYDMAGVTTIQDELQLSGPRLG